MNSTAKKATIIVLVNNIAGSISQEEHLTPPLTGTVGNAYSQSKRAIEFN